MNRPVPKDYGSHERSRFMQNHESFARKTLTCNCGGPQYGTGHSPDCLLEMGLEDAYREAADDWYFAHESEDED